MKKIMIVIVSLAVAIATYSLLTLGTRLLVGPRTVPLTQNYHSKTTPAFESKIAKMTGWTRLLGKSGTANAGPTISLSRDANKSTCTFTAQVGYLPKAQAGFNDAYNSYTLAYGPALANRVAPKVSGTHYLKTSTGKRIEFATAQVHTSTAYQQTNQWFAARAFQGTVPVPASIGLGGGKQGVPVLFALYQCTGQGRGAAPALSQATFDQLLDALTVKAD